LSTLSSDEEGEEKVERKETNDKEREMEKRGGERQETAKEKRERKKREVEEKKAKEKQMDNDVDKERNELIDLSEYSNASELEKLGLEKLKQQLLLRGLLCGGTLKQRAERLFALNSVPIEQLKVPAKKRRKQNTTTSPHPEI